MNTIKLLLIISMILISIPALSQVLATKSLSVERGYQPVVITCTDLSAIEGLSINQIFLYAYSNSAWQPIPFQIDERDPDYYDPPNGIFDKDKDDELVFLAKDLGDKINLGTWIDNEASKSNNRYEIEVVDYRDGGLGWCYVFVSSTLTEADKSPTKYLSYDAANDEIKSLYYEMRFADKWYPEDMLITPSGGGNGIDFYERTKLRLYVSFNPLVQLLFDETMFEKLPDIFYTPQQVVRLRRVIYLQLFLPNGQPHGDPFKFTMTNYPYSYIFSGKLDLTRFGEFPWKDIRMSYDLNSSVLNKNTRFFSGDSLGLKNSNVLIDGISDETSVNTSIIKNKSNWTMATSDAGGLGTIMTINDIYFEKDSTMTESYDQKLYFWDNASKKGTTYPDFSGDYDTGDSLSYGDHGMYFDSYWLWGEIDYLSYIYFLPANISTEKAQTTFQNFITPLFARQTIQTYYIGVNDDNANQIPYTFNLRPNYPNPFNPTTTISFDIPQNEHVMLNIYNVRGELISSLVNEPLTPGVYTYQWNGTDDNGKNVPSGIYICIVETASYKASHKMLLTK